MDIRQQELPILQDLQQIAEFSRSSDNEQRFEAQDIT